MACGGPGGNATGTGSSGGECVFGNEGECFLVGQ